MTIGQRIRQARVNRRMSIRGLAMRAGVDRSYLSELERGKCSAIQGPGLVKTVKAGLAAEARRAGLPKLAALVGRDAAAIAAGKGL